MGIKAGEILQMKIKIKRLRDTATLPTRESSSAAGYDLYADIEKPTVIRPHETTKIGTGIAMEIPEGYFGGVAARSGLSSKEGLRPANCYGIVDSDYRGEIIVALHNDSETARVVTPQERIGQIIIQPYLNVEFDEADELSDTERGTGGFGSTGK
jgi:dUTP pyrophosphatase